MSPISHERSEEGRALVLVPTQAAAAQLADRLLGAPSTGLGSRAVWTRDVTTMRALVERILLSHTAPRRRLDGVARGVLVAELVRELEPEVRRLFGPGLESPGAARAVGAAIAEIRQADLTAEQLAEVAPGRRRLAALAAALHSYEERLAMGGWWDDADLAREAATVVRERAWCPEGIDVLLVRGVYDVTHLQGQLLRAVARRARRIRIEVPFDPDNPTPYAYAYPYIRSWERMDDPGLDVEIVYPEILDQGLRGKLLRQYRRPDRAADDLALPLGASVALVAASDPDAEVRELAEWLRSCARRNLALEDVGVVLASPDYRLALRRELDRHGIAWHARRDLPLAQTPLFAAILHPFRLIEDGIRREDLRAWAASPLTTSLDARAARYALARGPAGSTTAAEWRRAFERERRPEDALVVVCDRLSSLAAEERSPAEFWPAYEGLLATAGVGPESGDDEGWEAWQSTLGALERYLSALDRWDAPRLGWRAHRRLLSEALAGSWRGAGRPGRGVAVLDPFDARGLSFRACAMVGLTEGTLIRSSPSEAILGDSEREALNDHFGAGIFSDELFRTSRRNADEAALLLLERVLTTGDDLVLSYPIQNREGTPNVSSIAWEDARRALGLPLPAQDLPPSLGPTWRLGVTVERVEALQRIERERTQFFGRDRDERRGGGGPYSGVFRPEAAADLVREFACGVFASWSPSKLESWRQCPHRFFQGYILRIKRLDDSPVEAAARSLGNLAHEALRRIVADGDPETPPTTAAIEAALEEAEREIPRPERGDPVVWRLLKRRVARELARYFRYLAEEGVASPFVPEAFELAFANEKTPHADEVIDDSEGEDPARRPTLERVPPWAIETPRGLVFLTGRIDRIDRDEESGALHVIDYKYSPKRKEHAQSVDPSVCGVDRFQLFGYFLGARSWASAKGYPEPPMVTGSIHCLREPAVVGPLAGPPSVEIVSFVANAISDAAGGAYDPSPRDPGTCRYCDYRRSCRIFTVAGVPPPEEPS
jgi:hypothetical protein